VLSWLVLVVPLVIVLVGAWSYRWVQEDAFIDFRVIGNLLAGHGPVFNVGERVEVYSDPLWVLLLTVVHEIVPFPSLAWLSVFLGLGGTAAGVVLSGRAMQRLGSKHSDGVIIPLGLLLFSVVAAVWEFSTSGLEMGMVFGWIGLSFWLLVRTEERRASAARCALVMGLGTLIRPELILMSVVFLLGLGFVIASPGWRGPRRFWSRWLLPFAAAVSVPALYEIWRMAYFAMAVSNSELAKSGGGSYVSQGVAYFWNFTTTYGLWVPFLLALPVVVPRIRRWWAAGDRTGPVVLLTPVVAGVIDAAYVIHVGGDYMEARLLLPAYLCCCLCVIVEVAQFRTLLAIPLAGLIIWSGVCVGGLRPGPVTAWVHNMHDERLNWIQDTGQRHPVDVSGYGRLISLGPDFRGVATAQPPGHHLMLVLGDPDDAFIIPSRTLPSRAVLDRSLNAFVANNLGPAKSDLPFHLAVDLDSVGVLGYVGGSDVYIFDALSLANPIGSHTTVAVRGIPGHEKPIGPEWMIARFGVPGEKFPHVHVFGLANDVAAARRALNCGPLQSYLGAITQPLTFSQAVSNITHALTYTTMTFSPDANNAARQLCGG
jgi:arabinofuranosyltransferase